MSSLQRLPTMAVAVKRDDDLSFTLELDTAKLGPDAGMQRIQIHALITLLYMYDEILKSQTDREATTFARDQADENARRTK